MLWRALKHIEKGNYIDIGAQDPLIDSVSLAFYELGWRGIHIEPTSHYAELLRQQRQGDTIIQAAIGAKSGIITFFEIPDSGISTADPIIAQQHRERGFDVQETTVPCITLSAIFDACAMRDIHWLKIDVEGFEQQVLTSWHPSSMRPWVVVVESTLPLTQIETHETWESILIGYDYIPVYFDGLNRFYISNAHPELQSAFRTPPNVFDGFMLNGTASTLFHRQIETRYQQQICELLTQHEQQTLSDAKKIEQLTTLEKSHDEHVHALTRQHGERERQADERIATLNQALQRLQAKATEREVAHADARQALQSERAELQHQSILREQEMSAQLLAFQQQSAAEKAGLHVEYQTQLQTLQQQHTKQEQTHQQRIAELNQNLQLMQAQTIARETEHSNQQQRLQRELLLLQQQHTERERETATQLLALQQQSAAEKADIHAEYQTQLQMLQQQAIAEKIRLDAEYQTRLQTLQQQHTEQEQTHQERITELNQSLQHMQVQTTELQENITTLTERLRHESEINDQLNQKIVHIRKSWFWKIWRVLNRIMPKTDTNLDVTAAQPVYTRPTTLTFWAENEQSNQIRENITDNANPILFLTEYSAMQPIQHIYELFIYDDQEFVIMAYRVLLKREPDHHGMNYYLGRLRMGYSKESIVVQLVASNESKHRNNIKGLNDLIKKEKFKSNWLFGLFFRNKFSWNIMQINISGIRSVVAELGNLKSSLQAIQVALDNNSQIMKSTTNFLLNDADLNKIKTEYTASPENIVPSNVEDAKELEGMPNRVRNIYFQLAKAFRNSNEDAQCG